MGRKRLGEFLIEKGLVTRIQLESALKEQAGFGGKLGDILVNQGYVSEGHLIEAISEFKNIKFVDLATVTPSRTALALLSPKFCKEHILYPLRLREENGRKILYVVLTDSFNLELLDQIKFKTDVSKVEAVISSERAIDSAIQRDYFNFDLPIPKLDYTKANTTEDFDEDLDDDMLIEETSSPKNSVTPKKSNKSDEIIVALEAEVVVLKELVKDLSEDLKGLDKRNKGLLKLLINKGFITREEYFQELKR